MECQLVCLSVRFHLNSLVEAELERINDGLGCRWIACRHETYGSLLNRWPPLSSNPLCKAF